MRGHVWLLGCAPLWMGGTALINACWGNAMHGSIPHLTIQKTPHIKYAFPQSAMKGEVAGHRHARAWVLGIRSFHRAVMTAEFFERLLGFSLLF